jgi:hypothetical protein
MYYLGDNSLYRIDPALGSVEGQVGEVPASGWSGWPTPGLQGATVFLDLNNNSRLDPDEPSAMSGADGHYQIPDLVAGQYNVVVKALDGQWEIQAPASATATVVANKASEVNFNLFNATPSAQVAGTVFRDANGNKLADAGEGQPGFTVYVDLDNNGRFDATDPSAMSDVDGHYLITGLVGGWRSVKVVSKKGWDTGQFVSTLDSAQLKADTTFSHDFPVAQMHTISGIFFDDRNADGKRQKNEPALAGQKIGIWLYSQPYPTQPMQFVRKWYTTTGATGRYETSVPAQTIYLNPEPGRGRRITAGGTTSVPIMDGGKSGFSMGSTTLAHLQGQIATDQDSSAWFTDPLAFSGWRVFADANHNGKLDRGEKSTTTSQSGVFTFDLAAGTYDLRMGDAHPDFDFNGGNSQTIVAGAGGWKDVQFKAVRLWSLTGVVYNDSNVNKNRDSGEPGIAGVTVFADLNYNGVPDATDIIARTDNAGQYHLDHLKGLNLNVVCQAPSGWSVESPTRNLSASSKSTTGEFGLSNLATISGVVFEDLNSNGIEDASDYPEPPDGSWTVWVDLNNDGIMQSNEPRVTSQVYVFKLGRLTPGTYVVRITKPTTKRLTTPASYQVTLGPSGIKKIAFGLAS